MRSVDGVLFDFGGVVVDGPFEAFAEYERRAGLPPGIIRSINSTDPDGNAWALLERGVIGAEEFVGRFEREAQAVGAAVDGGRLVEILRRLPSERRHARPEILAIVARCRPAGIRTALVTNNIAPMSGSSATRWVHDEFEAVIESCIVGMRKPDPEIYSRALDALGTAAERTVMLDDLGINLKPARELGMRTIKVSSPAAAAAELSRLLGWRS